MSHIDFARLADAWIRYCLLPEDSSEREALSWSLDRGDELVREDPDAAWFLILEVLRRDTSPPVVEILSAGPLEDLLSKHGRSVIDRVEAEARANPEFASLLGGVWQNATSQDVWDRVRAVWDRKGWDGNAA